MPGGQFEFNSMGIGRLLNQGRLAVPPNQRSYAWEEQHVGALLKDLSDALDNGERDYFLGTVVFVRTDTEPSIVDGQQRLATTAIILATIRNLMFELSRDQGARAVDRDYLRQYNISADREEPRLQLNAEDNDFFINTVLRAPYDEAVKPEPKSDDALRASNLRLQRAAEVATEFFREKIGHNAKEKERADVLVDWVKFLVDGARVVVVTVPDEIGAFRMFETLNDRGLRASQADILKNYFFSRAGSRLGEAQMRWSSISGAIETSDDDDANELLLNYFRHLWVTKYGPTKEKDLAASIKARIANASSTMQFLSEADKAIQTYLALSPRSSGVGEFKTGARRHIHTIVHHLKVDQIKPLLFSIARNFPPAEQEKAFRLCVSWSVRFLIFGGPGGVLETQYSRRAEGIGTGKIKTAKQLRDAMKDYVPGDAQFEQAFATARVSRPHLARYYLRVLDKTLKNDPAPEYVANEDENEINLEHVMPLTPSAEWNMDAETGQTAQKFLGNMVLLQAAKNSSLGNKGFADKKEVYAQSSYEITRPVAEYKQWTLEQIKKRQADMAKVALKAWPLNF